jgi:hypothetical protein
MNNDDNKSLNIRWYDRGDEVSESMKLLEDLPDSLKRRVATYLIDEIINRKPYCDMFTLDTHYLIISEIRRRRWYDYDEAVRIFVELVRHTSEQQQKEICAMVLSFLKNHLDDEKE